jgi:hypothetical protein
MRPTISISLLLFLATAVHAGRPERAVFLSTREEIQRLSIERIRSAGSDYERVLVAAENRLRALYDNYMVAGGTPPTRLDGDVGELRGVCLKMQRLVRTGRAPDVDPVARQIIDRHWIIYRGEIDALSRKILDSGSETPESRVYWETRGTFKELSDQIRITLLFNTPPGERGLEEALSQDESTLLKACEMTPKKTRGKNVRVVTPHAFAGNAKPDIQAFYRSLDMIPNARPLRSGSITVPPGSRTVTLREDKARLVFRPKKGKGVAYVGQTETELNYDYLAVPPDTAYYFENTGSEPLALEFVGIKP